MTYVVAGVLTLLTLARVWWLRADLREGRRWFAAGLMVAANVAVWSYASGHLLLMCVALFAGAAWVLVAALRSEGRNAIGTENDE